MACTAMRLWGMGAVACFLILFTGCGGGETTTLPAQTEPTSLLLEEGNLQAKVVRTEGVPEPCSPVLILEEKGARAAATPLYDLGSKHVAQAAGILPSSQEATAALRALHDENRLACIQSTIEDFGPREGSSISVEPPVPVAEGEEGSLVRFVELDGQKPVNSTAIVSFRSSRCIATLLLVVSGGEPEKAYIQNLTRRAYGSLADGSDDCR